MPAVELRVIGQCELIPSALDCRMSHSVHCRHITDQLPFVLPGCRQVHASPNSMMTQELHITSFGEIFSYQMPREAKSCLLHDEGALFCGPGIPSTKQKSVESK